MNSIQKCARAALAKRGVTLTVRDGEYRVNFVGGKEDSAYYTTDLNDALSTGRAMAARGPKITGYWPEVNEDRLGFGLERE